MRILSALFLLFTLHSSAQQFSMYSEIHWRPDQTGEMNSEIKKVVGDSAGNTYVLYRTNRDFRVKESEFLLMNKITSIGASSFVMKLDARGNFLWGMSLNGGYYSDIACDKKGNVFVSGVGNQAIGKFMLAYLPGSSVLANGACNLLMKVSPAGQLIWWVKDTTEMYDPFSRVWLDADGNVFQYVMTNGARHNEAQMEKFDKSGNRLWKTSLHSAFPYAVEVSRAGETYYSCYTYKMKNGVPAYPETGEQNEVWKLDASGKKTVVLQKKYPKHHVIDEYGNWIQGDYFINQIAFNADNTPVFYTSMLMQHKCEYIVVMGRKYLESDGGFVFAEIGMDGAIISDLQLKVSAAIFEREVCNLHDVGVTDRHGAIYCGQRKWLFGIPVSSMHNEVNPADSYAGVHLSYVMYDARRQMESITETGTEYIKNYNGIGFGYMPDSTLYSWGKRLDAAIPAKVNHQFYYMYIERWAPVLNDSELVPVVQHLLPGDIGSIVGLGIVDAPTDTSSVDAAAAIHEALLYPNPTGANSIFQFVMPETTKEGASASFFVMDAQGKILDTKVFVAHAGENQVEVMSERYAMGTYIIQVICDGLEFDMRLVKI